MKEATINSGANLLFRDSFFKLKVIVGINLCYNFVLDIHGIEVRFDELVAIYRHFISQKSFFRAFLKKKYLEKDQMI